MASKKISLSYRFLRAIGLNYSEEEYGDVSLLKIINKFFANIYHALLLSMMNWVIFEPISPRLLRPFLLRRLGCKVGKGVFIGDHVRIDQNHADLISIGDNAHITGGCRLLCHQRNLFGYRKGDDASKLKYKLGKISIGKGCMIGMESLIMPNVIIGEGSIVGAYSLVSKSIPAWSIAVGRPAKVLKRIPERLEVEKEN